MQKLNVVFVGSFDYPVGMAGTKRVQHVIEYLSNNKHSVKILLINTDVRNHSTLKGCYKGVEYVKLKSKIKSAKDLIFHIPHTFYVGAKLLYSWKHPKLINIIYLYNGLNIENIALIMFSKIINYKIVVDIVEDFNFTPEKKNFSRRRKIKIKSNTILEKYIKYFVDGIIVISSYLERKFTSGLKNKIPILLIPNSAKAAIRNVNSPKIGSAKIKIVYCGTFGYKEGLEYLIRAFNNITTKYLNCELYLSGKGKNLIELINIVKNDRIKYVGYLPDDDFYPFIQSANILCMTRDNSKFSNAGFPYKLGEYLATGNPVISTNVSDVSLYLENYNDAIIVSSESVSQLEEALEYLITHPEEAKIIGKNGQKKWSEFFNPNKNGKKIINFLSDLN